MVGLNFQNGKTPLAQKLIKHLEFRDGAHSVMRCMIVWVHEDR